MNTMIKKIEYTKKAFSRRLNKLKGDMNLSELEKVTGISRQTLNKYLNCIALPNSDSLIVLADTFNVSCDYLLGRDVKNNESIQFENLLQNVMKKQNEELLNLIKEEKLL